MGNSAKGLASNLVKNILELIENRGLFAKTAPNCRPVMHLQECLGYYEMSVVLESLFAADSTMLHCSAKSKLMDILGEMSSAETSDVACPDIPQQTNVLHN